MKPDSERTVRYKSSLNKKRDFLHVHVSKELARKLSKKKRAILVRKGDEVRVMRGSAKGKTGKVVRVNHNESKVYIEGVTKRTARGREVPAALEPSNLTLINLESTPEREKMFMGESASRKEKQAASAPVQHKKEQVVADSTVTAGKK